MATGIEDTDEFKWAVKVVIRRQLRDLVRQLQDYGDEVAILSVNTSENMFTHFGTSNGEWFISEQRNLVSNFLNFCKNKTDKAFGKTKRRLPLKANEERADLDSVDEILDVYIPGNLVGEISTVDIECLVGRLVASIISGSKDKGKCPASKQSGNGVIPTPAVSSYWDFKKFKEQHVLYFRSGRRIKPKIKDGDSSPVKCHQPSEQGQDGKKVLESLESIDSQTLQRVKVKVGKGQFSSVTSTPIPDSEELEALAVSIKNELQSLEKEKRLHGRQETKVVITIGEDHLSNVGKVGLIKSYHPVEGHNWEESYDLDSINEDTVEGNIDHGDIGFEDVVTTKMEVDDDPEYEPKGGINKLKPDMPPTLAQKMESHLKHRSKKKKQKSRKERMKLRCEHCGIEIIGACNLKSHIQYMHLNIRNAECKICFKKFWSNGKVSIHMLDVHTRQCHSCKEYVVESEPWKEGMNNRMVRMVRCKCGTDVPVFTALGRKITGDGEAAAADMTESTEKKKQKGTKYACGACGKIFSQKDKCEKHAKCHMGVTDYVCDHCGVSFKYQVSLKKHLQNEHGITHHICENCGKSYSSKDSLRVHIAKTHNSVQLNEGYDIEKDIALTVARAEMILDTNAEGIVQTENGELDMSKLEEIVGENP